MRLNLDILYSSCCLRWHKRNSIYLCLSLQKLETYDLRRDHILPINLTTASWQCVQACTGCVISSWCASVEQVTPSDHRLLKYHNEEMWLLKYHAEEMLVFSNKLFICPNRVQLCQDLILHTWSTRHTLASLQTLFKMNMSTGLCL